MKLIENSISDNCCAVYALSCLLDKSPKAIVLMAKRCFEGWKSWDGMTIGQMQEVASKFGVHLEQYDAEQMTFEEFESLYEGECLLCSPTHVCYFNQELIDIIDSSKHILTEMIFVEN